MSNNAWQMYLKAAWEEYERSVTRAADVYPHYTEGGRWRLLDVAERSSWSDNGYEHGNWTAGFWFGTMWLTALGCSDPRPAELAGSRLASLRSRCTDNTTHDLGFMFFPSIVLGIECGFVDDSEAEAAIRAAGALARRFNSAGRYIQAFGPIGEERSAGTSTIDTMMNLPLLWWAASKTGEHRLYEIALEHSRTSARLFLRPDGSSSHLLYFDALSGRLHAESTLQGAGPGSSWSRGLAWAICGFAWAFAVTGDAELLRAAERAISYFRDHTAAGTLPAWDFAARDTTVPRDASAAAIAALGALILGHVHPDNRGKSENEAFGAELLGTLAQLAINQRQDIDGILLESNYSVPHGRGIGGATAWGDFFLGTAIAVAEGVLPLSRVLGRPVHNSRR